MKGSFVYPIKPLIAAIATMVASMSMAYNYAIPIPIGF